ncbi:MAG: hypothetical protein KatS3mg008_1735 [Acidimicrobiales bacterium]|nr:MAG: hypothetical protein KatS3mg008_1735 [Acidimicrobiales bacterium]
MRLEDLTPGAVVEGLDGSGPVTVVAVTWHGTSAASVTYRLADGRTAGGCCSTTKNLESLELQKKAVLGEICTRMF